MISEVSLSVQFRVIPKTLEVEYLVTNRSNSDIYLVDLAAQEKQNAVSIRPSIIEVALDEPKGELTLSSKLLPVSSNVLYPVPPGIYTSALAPSQIKKGMFSIPLPINLANGHEVNAQTSVVQTAIKTLQPAPANPPPPTQRELNITKVTFVLGVIQKAPGLKIEQQTIDDVSVSRMEATEAIHHQEELKVESVISPSIQIIMGAL
jgi:hypothetical protein